MYEETFMWGRESDYIVVPFYGENACNLNQKCFYQSKIQHGRH